MDRMDEKTKRHASIAVDEFGCTWDKEHGLGVMTHQTLVIEIGGADTAFLEWIAKRGLEKLPG
jgi:hypothetical protein